MFNQPPSSPSFPREEELENQTRKFLSTVFELLKIYDGYEPAVAPVLEALKIILPLIKDPDTVKVLISESVASCTNDVKEQALLTQKLLTALQTSSIIDAAKK